MYILTRGNRIPRRQSHQVSEKQQVLNPPATVLSLKYPSRCKDCTRQNLNKTEAHHWCYLDTHSRYVIQEKNNELSPSFSDTNVLDQALLFAAFFPPATPLIACHRCMVLFLFSYTVPCVLLLANSIRHALTRQT